MREGRPYAARSLAAALAAAAACTFTPPTPGTGTNRLQLDSGLVDAGLAEDATPAGTDAEPADVAADAAAPDAARPDAAPDAASPDAMPRDTGAPDAAAPDASRPDAGMPDSGPPDAGTVPHFAAPVAFSNLRAMAPAGAADMRSAFLRANGLDLYVAIRPATSTLYDVWSFSRTSVSAAFGPPQRTDLDVSGAGNTSDEMDLFFVPGLATNNFWLSYGESGRDHLASANLLTPPSSFGDFTLESRGFPTAEQTHRHRSPTLTADGLVLISATRSLSTQGWDLVEHTRANAMSAWSAGVLLGPLNTGSDEVDPDVSADGKTLFFASNRAGGYDLYYAERASLGAQWGTPVLLTDISMPGRNERAPRRWNAYLLLTVEVPVPPFGSPREEIYIASP